MANQAWGCPAWYHSCCLVPLNVEGRHCQSVPPGWPGAGAAGSGRCCHLGTAHIRLPLWAPRREGAFWLILRLQNQWHRIVCRGFKANTCLYLRVTIACWQDSEMCGFQSPALTLSSCLTLGKWLDLFELPLVSQSLTIMLPERVFLIIIFGCAWSSLLHRLFPSGKQGPLSRCGVRASRCDEKLLMASLVTQKRKL